MAKLLGTPDNLATKVAIALLKMSSQEEAAKRANIMGWDIARNYQPVHELYRELRLGPYRVIKNLRAIDVWQNYWPIIMSASAFLSILCIMLFILLHLRGRLVKANKEITHMAMHDPLTLLPNRRMFRFLAESAFAQAKREGWLVFFFLIDLDGFKAVNDTYGHESGDEVLRQVSRRLRYVMPNFNSNKDITQNFSSIEERKNADGSFRAEDHIARHGGDEFLSLLIHVTQKVHAEAIAQRIIDTIQNPIDIGGTQVSVGASIGISVFPNDGENFEELARTADLAMYDVKNSGKGTYKFYRKDLD
jgi:GGDEF domain-containing protein